MSEQALLAQLKKRSSSRDSTGFTVFDFLHAEGSPVDAWLYSYLCWPEFVEIDDMVFLRDMVEDEEDRARIASTLKRLNGDRIAAQRAFNVVVLDELFGRRSRDATSEHFGIVATRLRSMWSARLRELFPNRTVQTSVLEPDDGSGVAITFHIEPSYHGDETS